MPRPVPVICVNCTHRNSPGTTVCTNCGNDPTVVATAPAVRFPFKITRRFWIILVVLIVLAVGTFLVLRALSNDAPVDVVPATPYLYEGVVAPGDKLTFEYPCGKILVTVPKIPVGEDSVTETAGEGSCKVTVKFNRAK